MSYADWKQRSALLREAKRNTEKNKSAEIERACAAAYKSGEREGRKIAEKIAEQAIMLRQMLAP